MAGSSKRRARDARTKDGKDGQRQKPLHIVKTDASSDTETDTGREQSHLALNPKTSATSAASDAWARNIKSSIVDQEANAIALLQLLKKEGQFLVDTLGRENAAWFKMVLDCCSIDHYVANKDAQESAALNRIDAPMSKLARLNARRADLVDRANTVLQTFADADDELSRAASAMDLQSESTADGGGQRRTDIVIESKMKARVDDETRRTLELLACGREVTSRSCKTLLRDRARQDNEHGEKDVQQKQQWAKVLDAVGGPERAMPKDKQDEDMVSLDTVLHGANKGVKMLVRHMPADE